VPDARRCLVVLLGIAPPAQLAQQMLELGDLGTQLRDRLLLLPLLLAQLVEGSACFVTTRLERHALLAQLKRACVVTLPALLLIAPYRILESVHHVALGGNTPARLVELGRIEVREDISQEGALAET